MAQRLSKSTCCSCRGLNFSSEGLCCPLQTLVGTSKHTYTHVHTHTHCTNRDLFFITPLVVVFNNLYPEKPHPLFFFNNEFIQVKHSFKSIANLHLHNLSAPHRIKSWIAPSKHLLLETMSLLQVTVNPLCFSGLPFDRK